MDNNHKTSIFEEIIDENDQEIEEEIDWDPVLRETKKEDLSINIFLDMKDYCQNLGFNNLILEQLSNKDILSLI
jgi:hypothetical protein